MLNGKNGHSQFQIALPGIFNSCYLAKVVSVQDPENLARIQVRLFNFDDVEEQDGPVWARVAAPFAGADRGAFFIPDVDDEVLVAFVNGDSRQPIVLGGLWNGSAKPPESIDGDRVDRWTITGKKGTRIAIEESSSPTVKFTTPGGVSCEMTDEGGGKVEIIAAGNTVTIDSSGVSVQAAAQVQVQAATVSVSAGSVSVDSAMATFSGIVQCNTLVATSVISSSYTPGAGNVW